MNDYAIQVLVWVVSIVLAVILVVVVAYYVARPVGSIAATVLRRLAGFVGSMLADAGRLVGSVILCIIYAPLAIVSLVFLQINAASRFARAMKDEGARIAMAFYRLIVGNPARLIGAEAALEGFETRLPTVVAGALDEALGERQGMFSGYKITGTLVAGGSGAKLYIAQPDALKRRELAKAGCDTDRVVIKSFAVAEDGTLPGIVRESRALDAGKRMGLILEHGLTPARFFYVMRFVPGDSLRVIASRLHRACGPEGLGNAQLRTVLSYAREIVRTLDSYHQGGLWHKDVKPDNIIIEPELLDASAPGTPRLVDFGLVSSLRSAMTLTTHGTEYFRDPEMVRQALRGVKVHEVDGGRFDIYGAGAVVYSMIEDSFPAQGVLSKITRRCPPAVVWIIRRAMAEYDQRYNTTADMLKDLDAVLTAPDLFALKPYELPSMGGAQVLPPMDEAPELPPPMPAMAPFPVGGNTAPVRAPDSSSGVTPSGRPRVRITNWWTGKFETDWVPAAKS